MKWRYFLCLFALLIFFIPTSVAQANSEQLIIVNKATNQLAFYENGQLVRTFTVATGKTQSLTPEGTFRIIKKAQNVPYYKLNIPGGAPNNPLGPRWLGLNVPGTSGWTYGIHGNNNPSSIGKYVSEGCIRMHNHEVIWLYDRVKLNTKVIILRNNHASFDNIAERYGYKLVKPSQPQPAEPPKPVEEEVGLYINDEKKNFDDSPILNLKTNRVLVPMRNIFEELGADVKWDEASKQVTATKGDTTIVLTVGSKKATINGQVVEFDIETQIRNGRTYVPVRFVSEALQAEVTWDTNERVVRITKEPEVQYETSPISVEVIGNVTTHFVGVLVNDQPYVKLDDILYEIGAFTQQDSEGIIIDYQGTKILIDKQFQTWKVNDMTNSLRSKPIKIDSAIFVPSEFLKEVLGFENEWDGYGNILRIYLR